MMKPETKFKVKVLEDLRTLDEMWAEKIQQVALRGTPDILFCSSGDFGALELKRDPSAKIDRLQMLKLVKIRDAGGFARVVHPDNWPEVLAEIRDRAIRRRATV